MAATKGFAVTSPLGNNVMLTQYQHSHTSLNLLEDALDLAWFTHIASTKATNLCFFYLCVHQGTLNCGILVSWVGISGDPRWK